MGFVELNSFDNGYGLLDKVSEYRSDKTGLRVIIANCKSGGIYHLEIVVPTAGSSDKGEPHCLEHLCFRGCQRFPVSGILDSLPCLASETNAYTTTDRTVFTTTTASEDGLIRLLPLYLEHLHFPVLNSESDVANASFNTEVFHVNEAYASAGVVYSEMETALSEPSEIASYATLKAAYPEDCRYRWNTGGDPAAIPALTLANIRECHAAYYTAPNTTVVVMGVLRNPQDLLDALEKYEEEVYKPAPGAKIDPENMSPVWAHMVAPDIPSSIQLVTHAPSEQDSQDHYLSYAFRLKFPWCNTKKRVAMDTALRYLVEGSGAVINKEFVESESACAGSVNYTMDNVLWSLAVVTFNDVDASQSLTLAQQITAAVRSHMAENFDLHRIRSILQRELWKQQSLMELAPNKSCFERIVSYAVNCYCQKDCSQHHGSVTDGHDLQSAMDEITAYTELMKEPETYWRNFIRSGIELSEKYVVIVKPSAEMAHKRIDDRNRLMAKRQAEGVATFSVAAYTASTEAARKVALEAFVRKFSQKYPPLMSITGNPVPECEFQATKAGLKPAFLTATYESSFTTTSVSAILHGVLNESLEKLHQRPYCRQQLVKHDLNQLYDEVIKTAITEDVSEAIDDLYADPSWEKTLMPSDTSSGENSDDDDDDDDDEGEDSAHRDGGASNDDSSGEDSDDGFIEDLGSLCSDEKNAIVAYQFDVACGTYLSWILRNFRGKHMLHIVAKCLFFSHLEVPASVYSNLLRSECEGDSSDAKVRTVSPELLETFLNANFLEYYVANGLEESPAFNSLLGVTIKHPAEQFTTALKTIQAVVRYTRVDANRLLAMAKQELSYLTDEFKQAESVISDLHELEAYGGLDALVNCQSDVVQNVLLRAVVNYPHVFAPLVNCILQEFDKLLTEGDCLVSVVGNTRACDNIQPNSPIGVTFPKWLAQKSEPLPTFDSLAASNVLLTRSIKKKRLNMQWNSIEVGHVEAFACIPKAVIPPGCEDVRSHKLTREAAALIVAENYLRTTEGPIFQPIRDAGAAYNATMTVDEEGRTVALTLSDSAQPTEAYSIGMESLRILVQNCEAVLERLRAGEDLNKMPHIPYPTMEQFSRAKSGALYSAVRDLDNSSRVASKMIENALRQLDNDWMFEKLSSVTFAQFVTVLKELGAVFISGEYDLVVVSNSFHAKALHERFPELTEPQGYVDKVASALVDGAEEHSKTYEKLLALIIKARISLLSSECES